MNGEQRNAEVRKIFQDMPPSIPFMERYAIIGLVSMSEVSTVRAWISQDDPRSVPAIKLKAIKEAVLRYGASLQPKVGQRV